MKTKHLIEVSVEEAVPKASLSKPSDVNTVSENSLFARMLKSKRISKAYLNGEITRLELGLSGLEIA